MIEHFNSEYPLSNLTITQFAYIKNWKFLTDGWYGKNFASGRGFQAPYQELEAHEIPGQAKAYMLLVL